MKKKNIVVATGIFILFVILVLDSFVVKAGIRGVYRACPNGCYEGSSQCYCGSWANNEEDAKSGGKTDARDIYHYVHEAEFISAGRSDQGDSLVGGEIFYHSN